MILSDMSKMEAGYDCLSNYKSTATHENDYSLESWIMTTSLHRTVIFRLRLRPHPS
jgi:hypothetical protein